MRSLDPCLEDDLAINEVVATGRPVTADREIFYWLHIRSLVGVTGDEDDSQLRT
jgi:hypothetical protein